MSHVGMFYVCGDCSQRFNTESEVRDHIAIQDADGATHDGTSWSVCDDEVHSGSPRTIAEEMVARSRVLCGGDE